MIKKRTAFIPISILILFYTGSCKTDTAYDYNTIAKDSISIAAGEHAFNQYCSGCHNFRQDGIGPLLSSITREVSTEWLISFIKDPQHMIASGDERAKNLYAKYKVMMPSFTTLKEEEILYIIAFLNTHTEVVQVTKEDSLVVKDPIPSKIPLSGIVADLQLITQIPASSDSGKLPLTRITQMIIQPVTNNLFVLDLRGRLYRLQQNKPLLYMDMAKLKPAFINQPGLATGFGSIAFHPDFMKNGLLYTTHTEPPGTAKADFNYNDSIKVTLQWVLTEWKTDRPDAPVFAGKSRELLRINMVTGIHGMQEIVFNPLSKPGDADYGLLYAGIGDGGCTEEGYGFLAHNKANLWGTVIRIDPAGTNSSNKHYGIPAINPYAGNNKMAGEIYAMGFRNPHRITWTKAGGMLVSNVGQSNIESINLIKPGNDYGWPLREGDFVVNPNGDLGKVYVLAADDSIYNFTYPVVEYDHDEGKAVSGGYEYLDTVIPALKGKFLFGDIPSGRLFYVDVKDIRQGEFAPIKEWNIAVNGTAATLKDLCGSDRVDLHFGRDAQGALYIMTKADGRIYKIVSAVVNN